MGRASLFRGEGGGGVSCQSVGIQDVKTTGYPQEDVNRTEYIRSV